MYNECTPLHMVGNDVRSEACTVRILGAGPAGLGLAAELGLRGVPTTVIATDPFEPWHASYGTFEPHLPEGYRNVVSHRYERPAWIDGSGRVNHIHVPYVRLNTKALQAELLSRARAGQVKFIARVANLASEIEEPNSLVVDATGRRPQEAGRHTLFQSALGLWVKIVPKKWLDQGEMLFMDLRRASDQLAPSFLYAMREGELHFVQETTLVWAKLVSHEELRLRLYSRLNALGIEIEEVVAEERCIIPMGGKPVRGRDNWVPFGASAGLTQPASGYQLARTLELSRTLAEVIASGSGSAQLRAKRAREVLWPWADRVKWALYNYGANAIAEMPHAEFAQFIGLFCAQPAAEWADFVDGRLPLGRVLRLMARVYRKSDAQLRQRLFPRAALLVS